MLSCNIFAYGRVVLIEFPGFLERRVTRLIKASKQQKPTREAFISGGGSSSSLVFGESSSKLNVAQSELQACETQLANKERELEVLRLGTVRVGLHVRCTAMVNCGWAWGEMGKEGLRALESLDTMTSGHCELQSLNDPYLSHPPPQFPHQIHLGSLLPQSLYLTRAMRPQTSRPFSLPNPLPRSLSLFRRDNLTSNPQIPGTLFQDLHNRTHFRSLQRTPFPNTRSRPVRKSLVFPRLKGILAAKTTGPWR